MKQVILLGAVVILSLAGCNGPEAFNDIAGFQKFMAGTWKADKGYWEITFAADGTIPSYRNNFNVKVVIAEGGGSTKPETGPMIECVTGPCEANYNPMTKEVIVSLITDYYRIHFPQGDIEGNCVDKFVGKVSPQEKLWHVTWTMFHEIAHMDPMDPADAPPKQLTFTKISSR